MLGSGTLAKALQIPRSRFAPVKTTSDLLALRSDAYVLTADFRVELAPARNGVPPNIKLDGSYKFVDAMETITPNWGSKAPSSSQQAQSSRARLPSSILLVRRKQPVQAHSRTPRLSFKEEC